MPAARLVKMLFEKITPLTAKYDFISLAFLVLAKVHSASPDVGPASRERIVTRF